MTHSRTKFDELRKQAEFGELPVGITIVLWRCQGHDVTYHNADLNQLVLTSLRDDTLAFLAAVVRAYRGMGGEGGKS